MPCRLGRSFDELQEVGKCVFHEPHCPRRYIAVEESCYGTAVLCAEILG